ncbi:ABC transporter ATP-binding protein [Leptolyngbya sp. CCNP1308]|uniref:ABC transporter ATP-binding protein n=1 Tax=Leptolyngbya sp. CCNP1308 TaxID=3110255 RepID=UPI002B1FB809|nr:ABC transporter ATP-binding protein [Leptolyngbya sp. CCNP1308]MEA5448381.1 ABC transporter ATP-binding protein [Leptolyngbya sp. CCNP1308]
MSDSVIQVENLGKKYVLGQQQQGNSRYVALRDVMADSAKSVGRRLRHPFKSQSSSQQEEFWALKDVSFEVKQGEVVGIIGRNGAGKSTLLKILSRITEPTTGRVRLRGRVASLLEVGTGFHPELTGRENIFLNGAILGMSRAEINRKFDEIVDFAEVARFLDTPVKRYSSGMYMRLAFAVAAHMEPEILVVDEVLAVGDAAFQKKCLGKMENVSKEGRTVLFVSHNMGVLQGLVQSAIWLHEGELKCAGSTKETISNYLSSGLDLGSSNLDLSNHRNRLLGMKKIFKKVSCKAENGLSTLEFHQSEEIFLDIEYHAPEEINLAGAGIIFSTIEGIRVGSFNTYMDSQPPYRIPRHGRLSFQLPARQFNPGTFLLTISLGSHQGVLEDKVENCVKITINPSDIYGTGYLLSKEDGVASISAKSMVEEI